MEMAGKKTVAKEELQEAGSLETAALADNRKAENQFSKEQLLASERFRNKRDILEALLDAGEFYTVKAVEEKIQSYMKGKVI